jgi:hypothetical protein
MHALGHVGANATGYCCAPDTLDAGVNGSD